MDTIVFEVAPDVWLTARLGQVATTLRAVVADGPAATNELASTSSLDPGRIKSVAVGESRITMREIFLLAQALGLAAPYGLSALLLTCPSPYPIME